MATPVPCPAPRPGPSRWTTPRRAAASLGAALAVLSALCLGSGGVVPPPAAASGPGVQVKTVSVRGETAEEEDRVTVTWRGTVRNTGAEAVRVPVRLVARDRHWKPLAYLLVPAVEAAPGTPVEEVAVFEIEETLWKQVYAVEPQLGEEGGGR